MSRVPHSRHDHAALHLANRRLYKPQRVTRSGEVVGAQGLSKASPRKPKRPKKP